LQIRFGVRRSITRVGGNLNLGAGGPAVLTVGPTSRLYVDNGGINAGPSGVLNLYTSIDPIYLSGGTANLLNPGTAVTQTYTAYVTNTAFNLAQGLNYTLDTPVISGTASFSIGAGSADTLSTELILNAGTVSSGSSVSFTDTLGTLVLGIDQLASIDIPSSGTGPFTLEANPSLGMPLIGGFSGTIKNFQVGDQIIVDTKVAATFSQSGSLVSVLANGGTLGVLTFDTALNAAAAVGTLVDQVLPCFAAGTRIATERGEVAVEDLRAGDRLRVLLGEELAPVIWIGQRQVNCARHPRPRQVWPVRVLAGAFGPGLPHRDLLLSPDHAVYVNEVLIPVKHLINGSTIAQVPMDSVTYYHVELPRHDVLLAEGLPAESYLDVDDRGNFDNGGTVVRMHPDFATRVWEAEGCAELVVTGPVFDTVRQMLATIAAAEAQAKECRGRASTTRGRKQPGSAKKRKRQ
jgi:hypothetical protein